MVLTSLRNLRYDMVNILFTIFWITQRYWHHIAEILSTGCDKIVLHIPNFHNICHNMLTILSQYGVKFCCNIVFYNLVNKVIKILWRKMRRLVMYVRHVWLVILLSGQTSFIGELCDAVDVIQQLLIWIKYELCYKRSLWIMLPVY